MKPASLFPDAEPDAAKRLARRDDPATSKDAADAIVDDLGRAQQYAYEAVARWPGRTANELSELARDRDSRRIGKRLPELEELGRIVRCEARKCSTSNRHAHVWRVNRGAR